MSIEDKKLMSITNITLREYYAGLAMQLYGNLGFRSSMLNENDKNYEAGLKFRIKECAKHSLMLADALIAELEKNKN